MTDGRWPFGRKGKNDQPVPWPNVNLPARWHLNSRRIPVPPVPMYEPEGTIENRRRRALLPMKLRRDPAFAI
jgi:hypothetical protein